MSSLNSRETAQAFTPLQLKPVITNVEHSVKRSDKLAEIRTVAVATQRTGGGLSHGEDLWRVRSLPLSRLCVDLVFGEKGIVDVKLRRDVQKFVRRPLIFVGELVMPSTNHDADSLDPLIYFLTVLKLYLEQLASGSELGTGFICQSHFDYAVTTTVAQWTDEETRSDLSGRKPCRLLIAALLIKVPSP